MMIVAVHIVRTSDTINGQNFPEYTPERKNAHAIRLINASSGIDPIKACGCISNCW